MVPLFPTVLISDQEACIKGGTEGEMRGGERERKEGRQEKEK